MFWGKTFIVLPHRPVVPIIYFRVYRLGGKGVWKLSI